MTLARDLDCCQQRGLWHLQAPCSADSVTTDWKRPARLSAALHCCWGLQTGMEHLAWELLCSLAAAARTSKSPMCAFCRMSAEAEGGLPALMQSQ